jgi:hypothetical protein
MKTKWRMKDDLHLIQAFSVFVLGGNKQTRAISLYHDDAHKNSTTT